MATKIILTQEVTGLGSAGDIVEVKDGYARNYLVPRGDAIRWTRGAEKQVEAIKSARTARALRDADHAGEVKTKLEAGPVPLKAAKISTIDYKDTNLLRKFISDRGKIRARRVTGVSVQEQRQIAKAVKNAREVALLPYTSSTR